MPKITSPAPQDKKVEQTTILFFYSCLRDFILHYLQSLKLVDLSLQNPPNEW